MAKVSDLPRASQTTIVDANNLLKDDDPLEVDADTGLPRQIRAYVVVRDPRMTVIPHFFSAQECAHLLELVEGVWIPSMVGQASHVSEEDYGKGNIENALSTTRTSWSSMIRYAQTSVVERLEHRVSAVAGLPMEQLERMNMVRYAPGETFNEHHDGKFRPLTIFVYLNELPEDDDAGDTFFPILGLSFRPRRGTAVMWSNIDGDQEDGRMIHAGRPPSKAVKYGVNIFFNVKRMRLMTSPRSEFSLEEAAVVRLADLATASGKTNTVDKSSTDEPNIVAYRLCIDPTVVAVPEFLMPNEVQQLLVLAGNSSSTTAGSRQASAFPQGTQLLKLFELGETPLIEAIEARLVAAGGLGLEHLASLRLVCASNVLGYCNRGCGPKSVYVCLAADGEEIFFPRLGLRLVLRAGDCIMWPNVEWSTGQAVEDLRTLRIHRWQPDAPAPIGLDAHFHDIAVRDQQQQRVFVSDQEVAETYSA